MILTAQPISTSLSYLLSNVIWQTATDTPLSLTYNFLQQVPTTLLPSVAGDPAENVGWAPMTAVEQALAVQVMGEVSSVANITFTSSTSESTADILFGTNEQQTTAAYTSYGAGSYLPSGKYLVQQTHVEIENNQGDFYPTLFMQFVLHELANVTGLADFVAETSVPAAINSLSYTVESHQLSGGNIYDYLAPGKDGPTTPQILDILAWQYLYGVNQSGFTPSVPGVTESHAGNNHTYSFTDDTAPMTVWIGAKVSGLNCFDFSQCTSTVTIDLTPGTLSSTGVNPPGSLYQINASQTPIDISGEPYQNVGIAYGTTIQIGIANNLGATLYGDATAGHNDLLIGGTGTDIFVAGGGTDICLGKGGGDVAEFHDPYADYKITTGAFGGMIVTDLAAAPTDGTMILVGGFSSLEFLDKTVALSVAEYGPTPMVDSAADLSAQLDTIETYISRGYIYQIDLTDSGTPTISLTAAQQISDAAVLSAIGTPYALSIAAGTNSISITGPGNGTATTVVLPDLAAHYQISESVGGSLTLTDGGVTDTVSNVTALQFSDHTVFVASQTAPLDGGVSSARIVSLYSAVLGREPDAAGLAFYQNTVVNNPSLGLLDFSEFFLSSSEYTGNSAHAYAQSAAGDAQFITDIYQSLLHRAPDSGAVPFYQKVVAGFTDGLTAGTAAYAAAQLQGHAQVLVYYSVSAEFIGDVQITAQHPADAQHWLYLG